jgi:hypothetical protein
MQNIIAQTQSSRPTASELYAEMRSQGYSPQVQDFTYQYIAIFISIICLTLFVVIFFKNFKKIKTFFILFIKKLNNMKKVIAILLYLLFIVSLIYTTFFHVPKYAEYRDGNTKERTATGFYNITETYKWAATSMLDNSTSRRYETNVDLQIDYPQWLIIMGVECLLLLLPAVILYTSVKDK